MKLKWHGHSCFEIGLDNGGVIITDPFDASVGYPLCTARADVVLSSHDHFDHNYVDSLAGDFQVINTAGVHEVLGAKIVGVPTWHDDAQGAKRGANLIFVIEADGLRIAHLGDLGHLPETPEQIEALTGLDVMLIPIGGHFTIDTPQAVSIVERFSPRAAIGMHFHNKFCDFPVSDEKEFLRLTRGLLLPNSISITHSYPAGVYVMQAPGA